VQTFDDFGIADCQNAALFKVIVAVRHDATQAIPAPGDATAVLTVRWFTRKGFSSFNDPSEPKKGDFEEIFNLTVGKDEMVGNTIHMPVKGRAVSIKLEFAGADQLVILPQPNVNHRCQVVSFLVGSSGESGSLHILENMGGGAKIYDPKSLKVRSLVSSDLSINITENPTEIDFTATASSLWVDTIEGGPTEPFSWRHPVLTTAPYYPNLLTNNDWTWGGGNADAYYAENTLLGSSGTVFTSDGINLAVGMNRNTIMGCSNQAITGLRSSNRTAIGCLDSTFTTTFAVGSSLPSTMSCCSNTNQRFSSMECLSSCRDFTTATRQSPLYNVYLSCRNAALVYWGQDTIFAGTDNMQLNSRAVDCFFRGNFIGTDNVLPNVAKVGNTILADFGGIGGARLEATTNNQFLCRFEGGYQFWSDQSLTTGVELQPGLQAWSMISDAAKKENMVEVDYNDVLTKIDGVKVYSFNFIGHDPAIVCMGPTAQEWHTAFPCATVTKPVLDDAAMQADFDAVMAARPENDPSPPYIPPDIQAVDGNGDPLFEQVDAKNQKAIDTGFMLGTLLACIKELKSEIETLKGRVATLEGEHGESKTIAQRTKDKSLVALGGVFDGISYIV
jgi:hypothetical protein